MSATEELRRLLDERGVEWMDDSYAQLWCTVWHGQDGKQWRMTENQSGMLTELKAWNATPAQAIEATLGSGTVEKAAERIEVLSGFAREYLHRYGMLMSMAGEDVTDEVLAVESVINEVCGAKVVDA